MKRYYIFLILYLLVLNQLMTVPVMAQTPATQSAEIQSKLKDLESEIASKASQLKDQISKKLQNRAFIGSISSVDASGMEIRVGLNDKKVTFKDYTVYSGKKVTDQTDLKVGDPVAALGDVDPDEVLSAKKIIKLSSVPTVKTITYGHITANDSHGIILTTLDNKQHSISTDKYTDIYSDQGRVKSGAIKTGTAVIVSGIINQDNSIQASLIYLPPEPVISNTSEASPSAKSQK